MNCPKLAFIDPQHRRILATQLYSLTNLTPTAWNRIHGVGMHMKIQVVTPPSPDGHAKSEWRGVGPEQSPRPGSNVAIAIHVARTKHQEKIRRNNTLGVAMLYEVPSAPPNKRMPARRSVLHRAVIDIESCGNENSTSIAAEIPVLLFAFYFFCPIKPPHLGLQLPRVNNGSRY